MATNKYIALRDTKHKQCHVVNREDYTNGYQFIKVSWYIAGMGETGVCAIRPNETADEAATRAFGPNSKKNRTTRPIEFKHENNK